jgi:hypothetical protein
MERKKETLLLVIEIEGFYLDENDPINGNELLFTNQNPIYGYAAVPTRKKAVLCTCSFSC